MKFLTKYLCFLIFFCFLNETNAQKPQPPTGLTASKTFSNRILLKWEHNQKNLRYSIFRKKPNQIPERIATIENQIFDDRDSSLILGVKYEYQVFAVTPNGLISDGSNKDLGMKIIVADPRDTNPKPESPACLNFTILESKASAQGFVLKFLAASKCRTIKNVQLSLYRSDDEKLDEKDNLLSQQSFESSRTRGALFSKNNGEPTEGYLLLKVATNDDSFIIASKIK